MFRRCARALPAGRTCFRAQVGVIVNDMAATNIDGAFIESIQRETADQPPALVQAWNVSLCVCVRACGCVRAHARVTAHWRSAQLQNGCMCCGFASGSGGNSLFAAIATLMRAAEARGQVHHGPLRRSP